MVRLPFPSELLTCNLRILVTVFKCAIFIYHIMLPFRINALPPVLFRPFLHVKRIRSHKKLSLMLDSAH